MGSAADAQAGDALRAAQLAVRNVGWQGGAIVGRAAWDAMVDRLIDAAKAEAIHSYLGAI